MKYLITLPILLLSFSVCAEQEYKLIFKGLSDTANFQDETNNGPLSKEFRDDFDSDSLDSERWKKIGESNGTIEVNNGELTISNQNGSDWISVVSETNVPNGYKITIRSKHLEGRHANLIGFGSSPYSSTPRWLGHIGYTTYSRADNGTFVYGDGYDENQDTAMTDINFDASSYNTYEVHRIDSTTIKTYRNGNLLKEETSLLFENSYPTFITADNHNTPNTVVVDWIEVSKISTN